MKKLFKNIICFSLALCLLAAAPQSGKLAGYNVETLVEMKEGISEGKTSTFSYDDFARAFSVKGFEGGLLSGRSRFMADKQAYAADADTKIVFFDYNGQGNAFVDQGSVIKLDTSSFSLAVSRVYKADLSDAAFAAGTTMEFSVVNGEGTVISLVPDANLNDNHVTVMRKGPGKAVVSVAITENGATRYATITIHVQFKLVRDAVEWEDTGLSGFADKVLFLDQKKFLTDPTYQLQILYMDSASVNSDSIDIVKDKYYDESVVRYSNGKLTVVGAGYTRVTLSTKGTNPDTESFYVLVSPIGNDKPVGPASGNNPAVTLNDYKQKYDLGTVYSDHFTLYTNAKKATNLSWTVYLVDKNGGLTEISKSDHSRLTYEISSQNGVVNFSGVKAGTYRIVSEANTTFNQKEERNRTVYDVMVALSLKDTHIYLNVGDSYDVLANSNIPESVFSKIYTSSYQNDIMKNYAVIEGHTIKAKGVGTSEIIFHYSGTSLNSLFNENINWTITDVTYYVHVIDAISISNAPLATDGSSEFTMFAGGQYPLYASCTNKDYDVYWESLDTSIATLEDNGMGSVLVNARKKGVVTVRAYQVIDGVEKNAYATITVKNTATKIELNPAKVNLEIGKFETVIAKFTGDATDLTWVTSDSTIFGFVDGVNIGQSVKIEALKPGTAILTAINPDNIVCGYCEVTVFQEVTGIQLSENKLTLPESTGTYQLYATLLPANASDSTVLWTSSKPDIVTVDQNGKITIKKEGEATIIAQSVLNPEFYAICTVTILQGVEGISLDANKLELYKGDTYRLPYVITPKDASDDSIDISIFDSKIINVTKGTDHTLLVKANNVGTTQFMVMTKDGKFWTMCSVTVKQVATGVKVNYPSITMNVGDYVDMSVTLTPQDATEGSLTWKSFDPTIATVSSTGRIVGVKVGTTTVQVKTRSGEDDFVTVTVKQSASSISVEDKHVTIDVGESYNMGVVFSPLNTTNTDCTWTSDDTSIVIVDEAGKITGLRGGHTVVRVKSIDGGFTDSCLVDVVEVIQKITVDPSSYILGVGKTVQITATITNEKTASSTGLEWYSEDESIATVDQFGLVTGVEYGETIITVEAIEGDAIAYVKIEVVKEVDRIRLNSDYETIIVGHKFDLDAFISPDDAEYQDVTWTLENEEGTANSIARIDEDGVVTGIKAGKITAWAHAKDNSGKTAGCYIVVIDPIASSGITLSDTEIILIPGEEKSVTSYLKPANSTDSKDWTTGNDFICSVDENGKITANNVGVTNVSVMTSSGKSATVKVTVLGLSRTTLEMPIYTTQTIILDGATGTVRWDCEDHSICDVSNGTITARKVGSTVVTATVNGRTLECILKVTKK